MPAISEALGVARACGGGSIPYLLSFVINRQRCVLDGTPLAEAMQIIDEAVSHQPAGYMVNCVYPTFLCAVRQSPEFFTRLLGIQANASSKDHTELEGSALLQQDDLSEWGELMLQLNRDFGVMILGGCCGTDDRYIRYPARA